MDFYVEINNLFPPAAFSNIHYLFTEY